jgi:TRAP-type mannitol/chloroaromatic compound transport system substrate-binding protein
MKRREFLGGSALGAAAISAPALAQSAPEVRWRLISAAPRSADIRFGGAELLARYVAECTDGRFRIELAGPGDVAGATGAAQAAAAGTVEAALGTADELFERDPSFGLLAGAPFALNTRQYAAWWYENGGIDLANEFLAKAGLYALPAGNGGARMGGWFRRELGGADDLKGLRVAATGLAGELFNRLGAAPQRMTAAESVSALEKGTLDGAESMSPVEDEKLGFAKAAVFIHYPGWWSGTTPTLLWLSLPKWRELPKSYQAILSAGAAQVNQVVTARFDGRNPAALRRLVGAGAQLRPWKEDVIEAGYKAAGELYADLSGRNPDFKRLWDSMRAFRGEEYLWFQVAEYTFDNFMIRARARGG